ncbi:MAG TPA: DNA topoisomerase, partial [Lacunisphaera sp.]|nr:DNA topoisomerase [Lacunisphaera sp.]
RQTLGNLHGELRQHAERVLESGWVQPNKRIFNNAQVSDHFAIIPTQHEAKHLDEAEAKLFDMIARRFVATFHPVAEFDITTRISTVAGHAFKTEGKVLTAPGWLAVYGKTTDDESADAKALPALSPEDKSKAKTLEAKLHEESTRPPPRYSEATLLSAMEGAGKLVDDEELAEAMKERGLGTPATRADTIEGLLNQKYLDRAQRELVPTTKAEQLFQFLEAVKIENLTSPAMTGEWEFHLREMEHGKFSREKFMAEIVRETKGIVERVKGFEEDDSVARTTDIISPTDGKPLKETLRGYKSQDGELMVYKIVGGRRMEEAEVKQLVETKQVGPLDGFISNKTRNRFSAVLKLEVVEETKKDKATKQDVTTRKWKTAFDFGDKVDIATLTPFWTDPKTGAEICESGSSYIVREKKSDGTWEQTFRVGRIMCQKPIPPEQAIKLIGEGKTDLIENFISKKGRPFSAFLKRDGGKFSWEFPPRAPKLDKDGNPIVRKPKAKADLSKAKLLGESRAHAGGQLVELGDAYYVRKPDQDNRQVFKLSKKLCEIDITPEQVQKLLTDGRSDLIEGFVSKRGNKFSAYLVMSQKQDKAEFEFPPR